MRFENIRNGLTMLALSVGAGLLTACASQPLVTTQQASVCAPLQMSKAELMALRESKFEIEDETRRAAFALGLVDCFADTDPDLRDGVGYEGLSALLRSEKLSDETVIELAEAALASLNEDADAAGVRRPFAALGLSEIARADRVGGMLPEALRARLVSEGAAYLSNVRDYRGFVEGEGWRHGVAHASDLMMQLALNPATNRAQLDEILAAVASQIIPADDHFYTFGEPERLARPVVFIAAREELSEEDWASWFASISDPSPFESWGDVYMSEAGLSKRHNLNAFAEVIYIQATASEREALAPLKAEAFAILRALS